MSTTTVSTDLGDAQKYILASQAHAKSDNIKEALRDNRNAGQIIMAAAKDQFLTAQSRSKILGKRALTYQEKSSFEGVEADYGKLVNKLSEALRDLNGIKMF